jgi:transposase
MKLQDVILRAIAKKISWLDAAEIAGLSVLTIARMRQKYEEFGYDGLYDQERHKRHIHRVPLPTAEKVLALYQQSQAGLSPHRFQQKLRSEHGIRLPYSWVKQALLGAGLVTMPRKPEAPPQPVLRKPMARRVHFVRSASLR